MGQVQVASRAVNRWQHTVTYRMAVPLPTLGIGKVTFHDDNTAARAQHWSYARAQFMLTTSFQQMNTEEGGFLLWSHSGLCRQWSKADIFTNTLNQRHLSPYN